MKKLIWGIPIIVLLLGCQKLTDTSISIPSLNGYTQKGPYSSGTQVLMYELKSNLTQTGKIFTTTITDNRGSFTIKDIKLISDFVLLSANGFYYNEVQGLVSVSQLQLFALSDIKDESSINVNILTHLEKRRVEYLVSQGKTFTEAKKIAQTEILAVFGITGAQARVSEKLDITTTGEDNAMLLAISVILQGKLSVGELSELLSFIASDMEKDGTLESESIKTTILNNALLLNLPKIRQNLVTRYQNLGLPATIPDFEKYILAYINLRVALPTLATNQASEITASSFKSGGNISNNGGAPILSKGLVWSTSPNPTISLATKTNDTISNVIFSSNIMGLSPKTKYYFRAYATNIKGTAYGNELEITTLEIDITSGLVAYFPFNGNANDESGNGINGIINGGVTSTTDRFNNPNSAFIFNGIDGYIRVPGLDTLKYTPITYSAWVIVSSYFPSPEPGHKFKAIAGRNSAYVLDNGVIGFYADGNLDNGLYDNQFAMWRGGGTYPNPPVSKSIPELNKWIHIAYTQNISGDWVWYMNGNPTNSGNFTNLQNQYSQFQIGSCDNHTPATPVFWDNKLDEIRIYKRALTQAEIIYLATH